MHFVFISFLICAGSLVSQASTTRLEKELKKISKSGTRVSAQIVNLTNTRTLLSLNPDQALNPASSIKLATAYTALKRLGIGYQYETSFFTDLKGSICVKGSGDPSLVTEDLWIIAEELKRKGVDSFKGKMIIDASAFDDEILSESQQDEGTERAYNAPVYGVNINYNTVTVFVNAIKGKSEARIALDTPYEFLKLEGKVAVSSQKSAEVTWNKKKNTIFLGGKISEVQGEWRKPFRINDPETAFFQAIKLRFQERGIETNQLTQAQVGTCSGEALVSYRAKSLPEIIRLMNKYSNNFIADALVKTISHEVNRGPGTQKGGIDIIKDELKKIGIDLTAKGRSLTSGSGLTQENALSAGDFIRLLKVVHQEKNTQPEFFASLPIAGRDGTLKRKYVKSDVEEKLRGKTGSLTGVKSLVGVYPNRDSEWIGIALIVNGGADIPEEALSEFLSAL